MENENKDFQGVENEDVLTPEEKVQEDIRSKVADAAAEIQDEIDAVNNELEEGVEFDGTESIEGIEGIEGIDFDENGEVMEMVKPEPVKVTVKRSSFIISLICSAVVGALVLLLGLQIPKWIEAIPEGSTVATVNGESITDLDVEYYTYVQAMKYAQKNNLSEDDLKSYDWNQEVDGKVLSNTLKENAVKDAIDEVILIQKGAENGIVLEDKELTQIKTQVDGIKDAYGEDGFALRARTMGISSLKQYEKMFTKAMTMQKVQTDVDENPSNYYPEDTSVLNDYIQPEKASVKHILISNKDTAQPSAEGEEAPPAEDKKAKADEVLQKAKSGEDFDALVSQYNEDPGATEAGYTFEAGTMDPAFEAAAFALNIGDISEIVESAHGYHIIKRIPGLYELQPYWQADSNNKIKIKTGKIEKIDVTKIITNMVEASKQLEAEEANASAEEDTASK